VFRVPVCGSSNTDARINNNKKSPADFVSSSKQQKINFSAILPQRVRSSNGSNENWHKYMRMESWNRHKQLMSAVVVVLVICACICD
jgi:hypothetical protein